MKEKFDKKMLCTRVDQIGSYCIIGGIAQGVILKDMATFVSFAMTAGGIVLCLVAAYYHPTGE